MAPHSEVVLMHRRDYNRLYIDTRIPTKRAHEIEVGQPSFKTFPSSTNSAPLKGNFSRTHLDLGKRIEVLHVNHALPWHETRCQPHERGPLPNAPGGLRSIA